MFLKIVFSPYNCKPKVWLREDRSPSGPAWVCFIPILLTILTHRGQRTLTHVGCAFPCRTSGCSDVLGLHKPHCTQVIKPSPFNVVRHTRQRKLYLHCSSSPRLAKCGSHLLGDSVWITKLLSCTHAQMVGMREEQTVAVLGCFENSLSTNLMFLKGKAGSASLQSPLKAAGGHLTSVLNLVCPFETSP